MSEKLVYTPLDEIEKIYNELKATFASGKSRAIPYRKYQILQLAYMVKDNVKLFEDALAADLGRPQIESRMMDIDTSIGEVKDTLTSFEKWAKPENAPFALNYAAMRPVIRKEPKGLILIISPFNYPIFLTIPLIASALAAGNAIILKPSENTPATSNLLANLVEKYLDTSLVRVINGAVAETTKLLEFPWGHILYTGGGKVGKIIAAAGAKTLSPVSLELGGKSPVFVDPKCDLKVAAKRILWGKTANAGQTCVAPDYIIVPQDFQGEFVKALQEVYQEFYPDSASAPGQMSRLVSPQAFTRVNNLIKNTKGTIVIGGETDEATKFIAPTIVKDVTPDDCLMSEEIFGPVLPIMPVSNIDEGLAYVNAHDHPLSVYVFSQDNEFKAKIFNNTQSGSIVANETIIHPGVHGLPFGGIGPSGSGYHTGKYGFDMFTHLRSSLDTPGWMDRLLSFRYPPYNAAKLKAMGRLIRVSLPARPTGPPKPQVSGGKFTKWFTFLLALVLAGGLMKRQLKIV
ncbi:NAD-aldehyde dehydrogenase [Gymnopus androsaceus JB14]|uniref:Aldehyde dehydrogenase n=1 Tax=Gymnopus androsaceus JB14 TaxID=1447944 RepID=A0A6A4H7P3_9AGAR|nr:NAD-aldehyde dehydrogenase [Gymnopus androsaceus JB14]